jgi:glycosyltransferase involved in cell wall biosynthesis
MRVVIAGDFPDNPLNIVGGIQAVIYNTLDGLRKFGDLDIHIVSCEKWGKASKQGKWLYQGDGWLAYHLRSNTKIPHTLSLLTIDRYHVAKEIRHINPDIIHAHGQAATYPWAAFDTNIPSLVTVHGINTLEAKLDRRGGSLQGGLRAYLWNKIELACLKRAQDIIIISPFVRNFVQPYTNARLHYIENPVQNEFFKITRKPIPGQILYVGSIQKRKGLTDLINAVALLKDEVPNVHLRVAGETSPVYKIYGEMVRNLVSDNKIEDRIHFLGHLNRDKTIKEYQHCSVFCLPSHLEASPTVVAEAMAAGCPIVTTRIDSTEHLVSDGSSGFRYAVGNKWELVQKLKNLLLNRDLQEKFGNKSKQIAEKRFRSSTAASETYKLYKDMLS